MAVQCKWTLLSVLLFVLLNLIKAQEREGTAASSRTRCYDDQGNAQRCIPGFENAAFNVLVEATNTCGNNGPSEFCVQTGHSVTRKSCDICSYGSHPAYYLTDLHNKENHTWWQSETMFEGIQYPNQVNLTLHLRKAFDITYVRLLFHSPRPESFSIYKRTREDGPWVPYQFYSATCRDTYSQPDSNFAITGDETRALCTSEYSDISPLTGGNVAFSTLQGRPSAYHFDSSAELQEWVTATDIRIVLDRLNTFGDEVFGDEQVLRSYFYAISDFAVGARCKCNGHASECVASTSLDGTVRKVCRCEHNTMGPDCNECLPLYNDQPWGRASATNSHECKACNCNGFSNRCFFDKELYNRTGHGGHCLECTGNRDGPNCERCKVNYYQREDNYCVQCNCNEVGSVTLQCNSEGRCECKPGVTGEKCDRCDINYYDFGPQGCKPCGCSIPGSLGNVPNCDPYTGVCQCKENVEGKRCSNCKPGYFNLDTENDFGCTPCFCYGHSSVCHSTSGYSKVSIESVFARGNERWQGEEYSGNALPLQYNGITQTIGASAPGSQPVYFVAPDRFLGDQRASYNQLLSFKLRTGDNVVSPTVEDIVLEGMGLSITQAIFGQDNSLPSTATKEYKFRLHEHPDYGWQPRLSSRDFISVLSNLTAIKIRATYSPQGVGFLDDVKLETAREGAAGQRASWIETCTCLEGYVGQFCESCAPQYHHEPANGGPFAPCVPCNCNGHADNCDPDTGYCICKHNTTGENCEQCARGYYGNALQGTAYDCKLCPCPNNGACTQLVDETVVCLECPSGYGGPRCDLCSDGYFGDPTGRFGPIQVCRLCDCNDNIDQNAVGNCNRTSGECLKCVYNTAGRHCEKCMPGFYGDALSNIKGDCKPCQCYPPGTIDTDDGPPACDQISGQCHCKPNVKGKNCDQCEDGYYNIESGQGCEPCNCNSLGSVNYTCDIRTGQCICRPGVTGQRCDACQAYHYGFSSDGCKTCDCDHIGSLSLQCDPQGQCPCLDNVEGRECNRCKENKFDRQRGCVDCPPCYNLVQDAVNIHRAKLNELEGVLANISVDPTVVNDTDFEMKLKQVQRNVENLWNRAKERAGGEDKSALERLEELRNRLKAVDKLISDANNFIENADIKSKEGNRNVTAAEDIIERAAGLLQEAQEHLDRDGKDALAKAEERSAQLGQQSKDMTEIAHEARILAKEQLDIAENITKTAEQAVNVSATAYNLATDAIKQQNDISADLRTLKKALDDAASEYEQTKQLAEDAKKKVNAAYNETFGIYQDIYALTLPNINATKIKQEADAAASEAERLKEEANNLLDAHKTQLEELEEQLEESEDILIRATEQQQIVDELLADVDVANNKAEAAVKQGDQTLKEAQETLKILQGFDEQVQGSKAEALAELSKIPSILRLIGEAENKTSDARHALGDAVKNAEFAKETAEEARADAEQASEDARQIQEGARDTKEDAVKLKDETVALAGRVADTEGRVRDLEGKTQGSTDLITNAKSKVDQAKSDADNATRQVEQGLQKVQEIINELNSLPDTDNAEILEELEQKLNDAEEQLRNARIDESLQNLKEIRQMQAAAIKNYDDEIRRLEEEVNNIEDIKNSLPEGCWKRFVLEP